MIKLKVFGGMGVEYFYGFSFTDKRRVKEEWWGVHFMLLHNDFRKNENKKKMENA